MLPVELRQIDQVKDVPLVMVFLGKRVPRYVFNTVSWIRFFAPENPIFLICNDGVKIPLSHHKFNLRLIHTSSLASDAHFDFTKIREQMQFWGFEQKYFWQFTAERLFWLGAWYRANQKQYNSFIHFESDSIPLLKLSSLCSLLSNSEDTVFFPRQNSQEGCASFLYVKGHSSWNLLTSFMEKEFDTSKGTTDMKLLSAANHLFPQYVKVLPRNPSSDSPIFFDPVTYGSYFLGYDSRHSRFSFSRKRRPDLDTTSEKIIDGSFRFAYDGEEISIRVMGFESRLFNLHIHNKLIPTCNRRGRFHLYLRLRFYKQLPDNRFDYLIFFERLLSKFITLLRRKKTTFRLR